MRRGILADSSALFGLAFAAAPPVAGLASPHTVTRWVILQEARPQTLFSLCRENHCPRTARRHTVSGTISLPFRGAFHLSLTVLVHYRSLEVFSLGEWTPQFRTGLACPVLLRCSTRVRHVLLRDFHPLWSGCPDRFKGMTNLSLCVIKTVESYNPCRQADRFGLLRVRSPLLAELFLFLGILGCFGSPGALPPHYGFAGRRTRVRLVGFPHSEIHGYCACRRLPVTFRSLPRPSSASSAKASTLCPK